MPQFAHLGISIHALREEGDICTFLALPVRSISIHALREEGDDAVKIKLLRDILFQSTPSARRATVKSYLRVT